MYVDVRTQEEYAQGHYEGALHHDLALLLEGTMPDIAKDTEIRVYCRSGNRAEIAKDILFDNGFTNVTNVGGYV